MKDRFIGLKNKYDIRCASLKEYNEAKGRVFWKYISCNLIDALSCESIVQYEKSKIEQIYRDVREVFESNLIYRPVDPMTNHGYLLKHKYGYAYLDDAIDHIVRFELEIND